MMGSGGLVVMDEDTCMVDVAKFFLGFTTNESCGKCIPCREGTQRMYEILESIVTRTGRCPRRTISSVQHDHELENLATVIKDSSLCQLGQLP
jgi:NADH:ubiquinone oxidoreductase subunit F (NADH-binding)